MALIPPFDCRSTPRCARVGLIDRQPDLLCRDLGQPRRAVDDVAARHQMSSSTQFPVSQSPVPPTHAVPSQREWLFVIVTETYPPLPENTLEVAGNGGLGIACTIPIVAVPAI